MVVEIGPGRGALTEYLLRRTRVKAIELDPELVLELRDRWGTTNNFELVQGSALNVDWSGWGPGAMAGNLPYYVATAIICRFLRNPGQLTSGVFLIQKEVADRITAQPGTRDYGYLSVECQYLAQATILFRVAPGAFRPPPKVDSAVVRFTPHQPPPEDIDKFLAFASACFRQKRKMLRNNLLGLYPRDRINALAEAGARAEQLPISDLFRIYRELSQPLALPTA